MKDRYVKERKYSVAERERERERERELISTCYINIYLFLYTLLGMTIRGHYQDEGQQEKKRERGRHGTE